MGRFFVAFGLNRLFKMLQKNTTRERGERMRMRMGMRMNTMQRGLIMRKKTISPISKEGGD
jgi:hypothetical protein